MLKNIILKEPIEFHNIIKRVLRKNNVKKASYDVLLVTLLLCIEYKIEKKL